MSDELDSSIADSWSRTFSTEVKFSHKWTIENFSFHCQKLEGEYIKSSPFSPPGNDGTKWCLELHPSRHTEKKDYVGLFVHLMTSKISRVEASVEFNIIDVSNMKQCCRTSNNSFKPRTDWGFSHYIEKKLLLEQANILIPDDKLTIFCKIVIANDIVTMSGERQPIHDDMPRLNDDFEELFKLGNFSDVTLTVSGKDVPAHKQILAARSPVFAAMFKHDMKELNSSRVKIDDIEHKIFMEMLEFIYTDEAPNIKKSARYLLVAAEKYNIERLKALCVEALYESLSIENAVDILVLSHLHNANRLKTVVINFICKCTKDIMNTEAFESITRTYPDLTIEILRATTTRRNSLQPFLVKGECSKSSE